MRLGIVLVSTLLVLALPGIGAAQQPLRTAVDGTFAPHAMPRLEGGIQGFNVDLANEIGKRLKRPVEITAMQFSGILPVPAGRHHRFRGRPRDRHQGARRKLSFSPKAISTPTISS